MHVRGVRSSQSDCEEQGNGAAGRLALRVCQWSERTTTTVVCRRSYSVYTPVVRSAVSEAQKSKKRTLTYAGPERYFVT